MQKRQFPKDFLWGTATSAYQVEGAALDGGRGRSIWDTFSRTPGMVRHGHTGDTGVDQYHRYEEDADLMAKLDLGAYRFSISWPRILPEGRGAVNKAGIDYYKRLIGALHDRGIKAAATLYHWDLPQALEDKGGWPHRQTAEAFAEYADLCFRELGSDVDMWITVNEPWCSAILGYLVGVHAPGRKDRSAAYAAAHHLNVAHGMAVRKYRERGLAAPIGTTLNLDTPEPATSRPEDVAAADRANDLRSLFFLDPVLGNPYPRRHLALYPEAKLPIQEGDRELIATPIDFLGLNYYYSSRVAHADTKTAGPEQFREVVQFQEKTEMGWPITPFAFYRHLRWVSEKTGGKLPLYVTENGCAMPDELSRDGKRCHDPRRIAYMRDHLDVCLTAIEDGIDLRGYFAWSLIDNFEWAHGYTKRFGIVYADYVNQRRVPKDSFYYYRDVIAGNEWF